MSEKAPPPPIVPNFPPSRPTLKLFAIIAVIAAGIALLVFRQDVLAAVGMG